MKSSSGLSMHSLKESAYPGISVIIVYLLGDIVLILCHGIARWYGLQLSVFRYLLKEWEPFLDSKSRSCQRARISSNTFAFHVLLQRSMVEEQEICHTTIWRSGHSLRHTTFEMLKRKWVSSRNFLVSLSVKLSGMNTI